MHNNPTGGKYMIYFLPVSLLFTLFYSHRLCTGGKILQEGNQIIFSVEHNLFCDNIWAEYFNWGKIYDIFSPCLYFSPCAFIFPPVPLFFPLCLHFFPPRPCNNFSTLIDCVLGGKYCKREIKSYFPAEHNLFL